MAARDATIGTIVRELTLLISRVEKTVDLELDYQISLLGDLIAVQRCLNFAVMKVPFEYYLKTGEEE